MYMHFIKASLAGITNISIDIYDIKSSDTQTPNGAAAPHWGAAAEGGGACVSDYFIS